MENKSKKIRKIGELNPEEQKWLAKAVVTIILADNILEESQVQFIKMLSSSFVKEEPKILEEIANLLRKKEIPKLDKLEVKNPEHLIFMLNTLVTSIFVNENKQPEEVKNYFSAGLKLGVTHEVLMLKLTYQKERFRIKMAQKDVDEKIREIVANQKRRSFTKNR